MAKCQYCGGIGVRGYTICYNCAKAKRPSLLTSKFLLAHFGSK